ncbi:MAG: hypothetical protein M1840_001366 [Geoglossum simile]|nr:MAG: hypothetical protein M1840_001366 [Geoglossum simile]
MVNSIFAIRTIRTLRPVANRAGLTQRSSFHSSPSVFVRVGDRIPDTDVLVEGSPGNKINLAQEIRGKRSLIIGVPAAFSPACSNSHVPGYINHKYIRKAGDVFVVSVNDPFVTKAWGLSLDPAAKSGIRFLGDPTGKFTEALGLLFDGTAIFGNARAKRYALVVEDGTVKEAYVEPDNTGVDSKYHLPAQHPPPSKEWLSSDKVNKE